MPDFSQLLKRPAGNTPKPVVLPLEFFPAIIEKFEYAETSIQHIPCLRLNFKLTGWPDSIPEEARYRESPDGTKTPIDLLSFKNLRRDFMMPLDFSDNSWFYLDQFLRSCGLELEGGDYEVLIPQLVGQHVTVEMQKYVSNVTKDEGNQIGRVFGPHPAQA